MSADNFPGINPPNAWNNKKVPEMCSQINGADYPVANGRNPANIARGMMNRI
jgi:hypothetical protein